MHFRFREFIRAEKLNKYVHNWLDCVINLTGYQTVSGTLRRKNCTESCVFWHRNHQPQAAAGQLECDEHWPSEKNSISGLLNYTSYRHELPSFLWHFKSVDGTRFLPGNAEQDSTGSLCLELRAGGTRNADMGARGRESARDKEGNYKATAVTPRKKKWLPYDRTVFIFLSYKIYFCSISNREENVTEAKPARLSKLCACVNVYLRKSTLNL